MAPAPPAQSRPAPTPAADIPAVPRGLLSDNPRWHPEAAQAIAGIDRVVSSSVARWVMLDLDDPAIVTVYVLATPETPLVANPGKTGRGTGTPASGAPTGTTAKP